MNWILFAGVIVLLTNTDYYGNLLCGASPTPWKMPGHSQKLNPYIRHWEAADFDRSTLEAAHQIHIEQKRHRRKRDLNSGEYGPSHTIKLNFKAHDREFRMVLQQNPLSVFAPDVEIENTLGPMDYDISRIYTGSLEDDESSHIQAVLTEDNLLDGTIDTSTEQFYIEPAHRYRTELSKSGVHSVVYKLSDVQMQKSISPTEMAPVDSMEHCASEQLRRKMFRSDYKRRRKTKLSENSNDRERNNNNADGSAELNDKISSHYDNLRDDVSESHNRRKRWLPDEITDERNPPLPLDLDVPYNDESSLITGNTNRDRSKPAANFRPSSPKPSNASQNVLTASTFPQTDRNHNVLVNNYNPNNNNNNNNNNELSHNNLRNTHTKYKNIIVNTNFDNNNNFSNSNSNSNIRKMDVSNRFLNDFLNSNWTIIPFGNASSSSSSSRPSHKTHVEIITKHGATKKPNIIVNNYNPDVVLSSQNYNSHINLNLMRNDVGGDPSMGRAMYDRKSTCMLYLQADHTFFQKMGSDEASIEAITRHVQRANSIYRNTDFNGDGKPDNITFMIKRIKVHNANALKDSTYRFPGNYGVEKFLELFSEEDYDAFCLAYMFTYRDFEMGTLGLAWTGDLKNAGGVCEKNGHYRGSLKSLNTGIVTLLNYGKHVPPAVSHVTLAHEIGHNFGSPHDPEQCTPGGEDGNYIMFARATSGDKRNNNKFSPCSLKSIEPVLNAKARSAKGCFTEPQTSICGNGVVEPGEQCDCGWEEDCKDSCCFPMSRHPRLDEKPCTLTPRAMCSPSQGPCCTTDCKLKFGDKCRDDNGCRDPSFCDGRMPQCPPSVNKPNKTICNKEFVCYMGDCTGSICLAYGLESCQCLPQPNDPKTKSCELCCKQPGEGNPCKSSFEWNEPPFDVPDMFAKPGTPCNDYNGYCDVFQKCREVDPSGPLATLRKLLLSEESIASFKKWVQSNWYTVALAAVGVLVLLILSTKLLAKRSNNKLKSVTIIHSATTETVRLPDDNNGVIVHTAVRTKVPLKKKVRGERSKTSKTANGHSSKGPLKPANKRSSGVAHDARKKTNRVSAPVVNHSPVAGEEPVVAKQEVKKHKKTKKHKEIIDYSNNRSLAGLSANHTNTFGKVQKWLLESPIVTQPLSHIEHSSKVHKMMSKSQSTPERLVQKSPQKTKSVGNLSNEKVKLQVVYKPPFKFSLKLSKNSAVKTHVIGGGLAKAKRKPRSAVPDKKRVAAAGEGVKQERQRRTALLVRTLEDETEKLTTEVSEPNYETLNPKAAPAAESPFYENMQFAGEKQAEAGTSKSSSSASRMSRSSSNNNLSQPHSYSRSNSHNKPGSRRISENSLNLNRNFGSTQNLIPQHSHSQANISKSKKRSSLNLKHSEATKRSSSNTNLTSPPQQQPQPPPQAFASNNQPNQPPLKRSASSSNHHRRTSSRGSFSNIPRVSLQPTPTPIAAARPAAVAANPSSSSNLNLLGTNSSSSNSCSSSSHPNRPHTAACDDLVARQFEWPKNLASGSSAATPGGASNNQNRRHPASELPSDMHVMVSDVENLVS